MYVDTLTKFIHYKPHIIIHCHSRIPTFCMTSIFFLVNIPRPLVMINLACGYAQNRQIELLTLSGTLFVNFPSFHKYPPIIVGFTLPMSPVSL